MTEMGMLMSCGNSYLEPAWCDLARAMFILGALRIFDIVQIVLLFIIAVAVMKNETKK